MPYSDDYKIVKNVPVTQATTGYFSANGRNHVIIMNEELYMANLKHLLINPNQLRHYQTIVNDGSYDEKVIWIENPDRDLVMCLESEGTTIYFDT